MRNFQGQHAALVWANVRENYVFVSFTINMPKRFSVNLRVLMDNFADHTGIWIIYQAECLCVRIWRRAREIDESNSEI